MITVVLQLTWNTKLSLSSAFISSILVLYWRQSAPLGNTSSWFCFDFTSFYDIKYLFGMARKHPKVFYSEETSSTAYATV